MLDREEYVEQAYFFRVLGERLAESIPLQDMLVHIRNEVLATTKLPLAIEFLEGEIKHTGQLGPAMARLGHYFTPFQAYVVNEAEEERGRLDMRVAIEILRVEAEFRAAGITPQGSFMYQFESICRNRLRYDRGLEAMARDPLYDEAWRTWILTARRQMGIVDFADLLYVRSAYYYQRRGQRYPEGETRQTPLFGEKEGKIAWANRRKDPLFLFAALQRHLQYPRVPRPKPRDQALELVPQLMRRMERLETRIKLLEEEQREGIDITRFYGPSGAIKPPSDMGP